MNATFDDGTTQVHGQAYIEGEPIADSTDSSIKYYTVRNHFVATDGSDVWGYICGTQTEFIVNRTTGQITPYTVPVLATAVAGQWDYHEGVPGGGRKTIEMSNPASATKITFACVDGAIGKCVKMGYAPWKPAPVECTGSTYFGTYRCLQTSLEYAHEACVRMVRADYCGDGMPHTMDGMSIDIWDPGHINNETPYGTIDTATTVDYGHEAEWTPKGARCLPQLLMTRIAGGRLVGTVKDYLTQHCNNLWPTDENGAPFQWGDGDCFDADSSFDIGRVPFTRLGNNSYVPSIDMHDRVWLRNKSVCVDDSYDRQATSALTQAAPPSRPYSQWATNYNGDRYSQTWCQKCLIDPSQPSVCGIVSATP
jgi:hypothetical protein